MSYKAIQDFERNDVDGFPVAFTKGETVGMDHFESDVYPSLVERGLIEEEGATKKKGKGDEKETPVGLSIGEIYEMCEKAGVEPKELKLEGEGPFSTAEVEAAIKVAKDAQVARLAAEKTTEAADEKETPAPSLPEDADKAPAKSIAKSNK